MTSENICLSSCICAVSGQSFAADAFALTKIIRLSWHEEFGQFKCTCRLHLGWQARCGLGAGCLEEGAMAGVANFGHDLKRQTKKCVSIADGARRPESQGGPEDDVSDGIASDGGRRGAVLRRGSG